jgi:hypothetical protein
MDVELIFGFNGMNWRVRAADKFVGVTIYFITSLETTFAMQLISLS